MLSKSILPKTDPIESLELYGIAVAAAPNDQHLGYDLNCHTIGVSNEESFRVMHELSFQQKFQLPEDEHDTSLRNAYVRLTDVFDRVNKLQGESIRAYEQGAEIKRDVFEAHGFSDVPVSCILGQDSRNPAFYNLISHELFGEGLTQPPKNSFLAKASPKDFVITEIMRDPVYLTAIKKMVASAKACAFQPGNFGKARSTRNTTEVRQTESDLYLIRLRERVFKLCGSRGFQDVKETSPDLHNKFIKEAKLRGRAIGSQLNENFNYFAEDTPIGYRDSLDEQARLPSLSFDTWHPDYRAAVFEGINAEYSGEKRFVRFKLAMDPPGPFFTHPTADLVREKLQVLKGTRKDFNEDMSIRKGIVFTGERVLGAVQRVYDQMRKAPSLTLRRGDITFNVSVSPKSSLESR